MKHLLLLFTGLMLISQQAFGQTYSAWGDPNTGTDYATIANYNDTLKFAFSAFNPGAYGNARVIVYYEGDFGDNGEYAETFLPGPTSIGQAGPTNGGDCAPEDSTVFTFNAMQILAWAASDTIRILPSGAVDPGNCFTQRIRVRLEFDYCIFGEPTEYAGFTLSSSSTCPTSSPIVLTGTPAGGTFTGTGVSGNTFNAFGLQGGNYEITYTATDDIGCETSETQTVFVKSSPGNVNMLICENSEPVFEPAGPTFVFAEDLELTDVLDTAEMITFPAVTQSPTTYYYARYDIDNAYTLDSITNDNAFVIDHDGTTGDDRGGIAITDSTVYIVGDNNTARYDLDLTGPGVSLPVRDGIFTDLRERKIYSLYNSVLEEMPDNNNNSAFTVDSYIALDEDLNPIEPAYTLSQPIDVDYNSGIFAGYGELILYSGSDNHAYVIDLDFGDVTDMGEYSLNLYGSENWSDWGVAGSTETEKFIYYRDYNFNQIVEHNLTTDIVTPISQFSDVSDLSSFIMHPVNHRLYFHYEGGAQFGGSSETLGYVDAADSIGDALSALENAVGCPSVITYTFESIDLGADTTICDQDILILEAGFGYQSYTWNGDNNNWNIYPVEDAGQYILEAVNSVNCTVTDTINVLLDSNCGLGVNENAMGEVKAYPVPNNGKFNLEFGNELQQVNVQLFDMQGKICYQSQFSGAQSSVSINAEGLVSGMYIVKISSEEGSTQLPVIVE